MANNRRADRGVQVALLGSTVMFKLWHDGDLTLNGAGVALLLICGAILLGLQFGWW